jgi:chaperonin cofactor prefoldin
VTGTTFSEHAVEWLVGAIISSFTAAISLVWRLNDRVTKLETKYDAMVPAIERVDERLDKVDEKLDRLIDKLL